MGVAFSLRSKSTPFVDLPSKSKSAIQIWIWIRNEVNMPFTPDELGTNLGPEVKELVDRISKVKRVIKDIQETAGLSDLEKRLKKILYEMVSPDEKGHHAVIVDGVKAKVFMRKGREKIDREAALRLLHPNTYRAIFSEGEPYAVLEVEPARTPPNPVELFAPKPEPCDCKDRDEDYYA